MENIFSDISRRAGNTVKHWWLLLVSGILTTAVGITVFKFPVESYLTFSLIFGVMMLVSGIATLVASITSRNYFMMRGYSIIGGILDLILGIFLCCYPQITLVLLPVILGIWMMYHSFMIIGLGADLDNFRVKGYGWTIAGGVLMLILSLLVLVMPLTVGVASVIVLSGTALVILGIVMIAISINLKKIHKFFIQ